MKSKYFLIIFIVFPVIFSLYGCGGGGGASSSPSIITDTSVQSPADFNLSGQVFISSSSDSLFNMNPQDNLNSSINKSEIPPSGMEFLHQGELVLDGRRTILDSTGRFSFRGEFLNPGIHELLINTRVKTIHYILEINDKDRTFLTIYIHSDLEKLDFVEEKIRFNEEDKKSELMVIKGQSFVTPSTSTPVINEKISKILPATTPKEELITTLNDLTTQILKDDSTSHLTSEIVKKDTETTDISLSVDIEKIELSPSNIELLEFDTQKFETLLYLSNGSTLDISSKAVLKSTDDKILSLNGMILTANYSGSSEIRAIYNGIESNPAFVTISNKKPKTIELNLSSNEIEINNSTNYQVIATYDNGETRDITKLSKLSSVDNKSFTSDYSKITPSQPGIIKFIAEFMGVKSDEETLNVLNPILNINMNLTATSINLGRSVIFSIFAHHKNGFVEDITDEASKELQFDSNFFEKSSNKLKAILIGKTTLTPKFGNLTGSPIEIEISDKVIDHLTLSMDKNSIPKGDFSTITIIATYSDGTTSKIKSDFLLSFDNTIISSNENKLTGINTGKSDISVTYDGITSNKLTLEVTEKVLRELILSANIDTVPVGFNTNFTLKGIYSDNSVEDLILAAGYEYNSSIVSISSNVINGIGSGSTNIKAMIGDITSNVINFKVSEKIPVSLTLSVKNSNKVAKGRTISIESIVKFSDNTTQDVTNNSIYSYSDPSVAKFDTATSLLNTLQTGTSDIKASLYGLESNKISIIVTDKELDSLTISVDKSSVPSGDSATLSIIGTYSDKTTDDYTNMAVVNITPTSGLNFSSPNLITSVVGTYSINCNYNQVVSNTIQFEVTPKVERKILLTIDNTLLPKGRESNYRVEVIYSDGTKDDITENSDLNFTTDSIFTISSEKLFASSVGTTTVKASYNGFISNSIEMEVTEPVIDSISLSVNDNSLPEGRTEQLVVIATKSDNSTEDITLTSQYSVGDSSIISISDGILNFDNRGSTTLIATKDNINSNNLNITVEDPVVDSITLTPDSTSAVHGEIVTFTNKATWSNGDITDIVSDSTYQMSGTGSGIITDNKIKLSSPGTLLLTSSYNGISSNQIEITILPYFKEFIATNISSTSCNILVITHEIRNNISVIYGESEPLTADVTESENSRLTTLELLSLKTDTDYKYYVNGGTGDYIATDNNNGAYYTFKTAKVGIGNSYILTGTFMDGTTPVSGGIILVTRNGLPLMAKSDNDGNWFVNLANLKNSDGSVESYSAGDSITIRYLSPDGSDNSATYNLSGSSPDSIN